MVALAGAFLAQNDRLDPDGVVVDSRAENGTRRHPGSIRALVVVLTENSISDSRVFLSWVDLVFKRVNRVRLRLVELRLKVGI